MGKYMIKILVFQIISTKRTNLHIIKHLDIHYYTATSATG